MTSSNVTVDEAPANQVVVETAAPQQVAVQTPAGASIAVSSPVVANIQTSSSERVDVQILGALVGPTGPRGPAGTQFAYTYILTSVSSWNQVHDFDYYPAVRLVDATGAEVETDIEYPDATHVYISFPTPFTGTVILS